MKSITWIILIVMLALCCGGNRFAHGGTVLSGTRVEYDVLSAEQFGSPTIVGDTIRFDHPALSARSVGGAPDEDIARGHLSLIIQAAPGTYLHGLDLELGGTDRIVTPRNGAADNHVQLSAEPIDISVADIDFVPLTAPIDDDDSVILNFSPADGSINPAEVSATGTWSGSSFADLVALFGSSHITRVALIFDMQLLAHSQHGGNASAAATTVHLTPDFDPEPSTSGMMLVAMTMLLMRRSTP